MAPDLPVDLKLFALVGSAILVLAFTFGVVTSYANSINGPTVVVTTSDLAYRTTVVVVMEKGAGLLTKEGFKLLPWDQIKSLDYTGQP